MISLGIDHGTRRMGWSLFEDGFYGDSGFYELHQDYPRNLLEFDNIVHQLTQKFNPQLAVIEQQVSVQNAHSTGVLYELNGIEKVYFMRTGIPYIPYIASEWKGALGMGRCQKYEIGQHLASVYNIDFHRICVPVYYKKATKGHKVGDLKEYLCDESDAIGLNAAYWGSVRK